MTVRILVLTLLVFGAYAGVGMVERRNRGVASGLAAGVHVVTGPHCRICGPAVAALRRLGLDPRLIDASEASEEIGPVRSVPVVVVSDGERIVLRRSGRSVLDDAPEIAAAAHAVRARPDPGVRRR